MKAERRSDSGNSARGPDCADACCSNVLQRLCPAAVYVGVHEHRGLVRNSTHESRLYTFYRQSSTPSVLCSRTCMARAGWRSATGCIPCAMMSGRVNNTAGHQNKEGGEGNITFSGKKTSGRQAGTGITIRKPRGVRPGSNCSRRLFRQRSCRPLRSVRLMCAPSGASRPFRKTRCRARGYCCRSA
jgi:hypothetical protein